MSKSGHFLCAGTELFEGDAFLVFGDARSGKVLGGYWESHSDDITQVEIIYRFYSVCLTDIA